jgi:hypothetical protein
VALWISRLLGMPPQHDPKVVAGVHRLADRRHHPRRDPHQRSSDHRNEAAEEIST